MTPARRAKFERLVDAMERENYWCGVADEEGNSERLAKHGPLADAARAALTAFVEEQEGEEYEVIQVDGHYVTLWAVDDLPECVTQDRVRVVKEAK